MKRADPSIRPQIRQSVQTLLSRSPAFGKLDADKQRQIAQDMTVVVGYLAVPSEDRTSTPQPPPAEGGAFADLVNAVDFPEFVSNLIEGVFQAIVNASIQQMEAYAQLVAEVAKSAKQFADQVTSEDQARDYLVEEFPDLFEIGVGGKGAPCLRPRGGIHAREALRRVKDRLDVDDSQSMDLPDATAEKTLLLAARRRLVRNRQQLLAKMVLMGINRIVVTSGSIKAS